MNFHTDDSRGAGAHLPGSSIGNFISATEADEIFDATIQLSIDLFDPDYSMVASVEGDDYDIRSSHLDSRPGRIDPSAGLLEELSGPGSCDIIVNTFNRGVAERCPDVMKTRSAAAEPALDRERLRSVMTVPIGRWGVLLVASSEPNEFTDDDVATAKEICALATAALDRIETTTTEADFYQHLIRTVLHDIRSPLNVAIGYLELAKGRAEDREAHLGRIETSLGRINELLDRIQRVDRTGQILDHESVVNLSEVADRVWETIETNEATLEPTGVDMIADEPALRQILENLFRNAIEHGGRDVRIRIGPLPSGEGFYVEDDGVGIDPAIREDIFSVGISSRNNGNGIGLAIVARLVDAHGWDIRAIDGATGGARFDITGVTTA